MLRLYQRVICFCLLFGPAPALAQHLGGATQVTEPSLGRVVAAFIICVITGVALILFVRRRIGSAPPFSAAARSKTKLGSFLGAGKRRRLRVIESTAVSPNAAIVLLQCDEEEFLVGASTQGFLLFDRRKARPAETEA